MTQDLIEQNGKSISITKINDIVSSHISSDACHIYISHAGAVLTSTGNFMGRQLVKSKYAEPTAMDELFSALSDIYLTVRTCRATKEVISTAEKSL